VLLLKENLIKCEKDSLSKKTRIEGFSLAKLKLFHRSKIKEETYEKEKPINKEIEQPKEKQNDPEIREEIKKAPIKEYNETLYSKGFEQKQPMTPSPQKKHFLKRTTWENAETIEQNIDSMRMKQSESTSSRSQKGIDTEKKVDFILLKKKK
jgi:hypothetical protein